MSTISRSRQSSYDIVIPTLGRPSLARLLDSLGACGAEPMKLIAVADPAHRGPAATRNVGAARCRSPWIVFLDDDVEVGAEWANELRADLEAAEPDVAIVQGNVRVPLPENRKPTDWERNTAKLESAKWITADVAIRRIAFDEIGGFDTAFRRAYREDTDLVLRLRSAGWKVKRGSRTVTHPTRPSKFFASVVAQRGNADDQLLRARHGRDVRSQLDEPPSSLASYAITTALALGSAVSFACRRPRIGALWLATWLWRTSRFAYRRIAPGPRTRPEIVRMAVSSAMIPPVALGYAASGAVRCRLEGRPDTAGSAAPCSSGRDASGDTAAQGQMPSLTSRNAS